MGWNVTDIPNLSGKVAVVKRGNGGIGPGHYEKEEQRDGTKKIGSGTH